jgi:multicomponent Na+:H+ antiporter subunit G
MSNIVSAILMLIGSTFMFIAALGVLKMPDFLTRLHCSTKAGTLGIGLIFLSVAFDFMELGISTRSLAAITFLLLTAPVGAHVIGRAAYFIGTPLWQGTFVDELRRSDSTQSQKMGRTTDPENPRA